MDTIKKALEFVMQRIPRGYIALTYDVLACGVAIIFSLFLRVGDDILSYPVLHILKCAGVYSLVCLPVFLMTQLYLSVWRYVSLKELVSITEAVTFATILYAPLVYMLSTHVPLPRSLIFINWFVSIAFLGGARFVYRLFHDRRIAESSSMVGKKRSLILVGVNDHCDAFIRQVLKNPLCPYSLMGVVDYQKRRKGRQIHGVPILGSVQDLPKIIADLSSKLDLAVITDPEATGETVRTIMSLCSSNKISFGRLPRFMDVSDDPTNPLRVKPISLEDLLGRPQAALDRDKMKRLIHGKKVLVTGAGGTIGSELVRQICSFDPSSLIMVDHSEYLLYTIDLEIRELYPDISHKMVLADVSDRERVDYFMREERPQLVFHAAALKHVPIAEENPNETILTNVIGTRNVAEACRHNYVEAMVMVSTDKAVNPTSVMGASKRLAESFCQALDLMKTPGGQRKTRFVTVRFGNVLGSTGSVVPLFQRQLRQGGPLTVTDPDMRRYFMTVHESVELILQAAAMGAAPASDNGKIFVLDMGQSVKIDDLARHIIRLSGFEPDVDIKIKYTGQRPGEKLYEDLFYSWEELQTTPCNSIRMAMPRVLKYEPLAREIQTLEEHARRQDTKRTLGLVSTLVPEYVASPFLRTG